MEKTLNYLSDKQLIESINFSVFDGLSSSSKVWIYQSCRKIEPAEKLVIEQEGSNFANQWKAHGEQVKAKFSVLAGCLLVLVADEETGAKTSGCSIDSSVGFFRKVNEQFNLDLFNRLRVVIWSEDDFKPVSPEEFKRIRNNSDTQNLWVLNALVSNLFDLKKSLVIPSEQSWVSRY